METPNHLGGHLNKTHVDLGALARIVELFNVKSMLDIGCGPAGMETIAKEMGIEYQGVDGDPNLIVDHPDKNIFLHDFVTGKVTDPKIKSEYDLGWSVEFLEHVEEKYIENYMDLFIRCKYVLVTHALPGETGGHHHVNLKDQFYWIHEFGKREFKYDPLVTTEIRNGSSMTKGFMQKSGLFFYKV